MSSSSSSSCSPFSSGQIQQLRQFVEALKLKPEILHDPQLGFLRDYLLSLGAVLPKVQSTSSDRSHTPMDAQSQDAQQQQQPETAPMEDDEHEPDFEEQEDPESEVELDMTGVIEPDEDEAQPMGDPGKGELTEQEETQFSDKRSEALAAFSEGEWNKSIEIFTEAIILNPHNAVVFAKRGACFLKLKKPKACIRDCDRAIELNPDSAPAYKNRGRAHRLLGNFVEAARDLRQACKIDFDEQTDEWLKEVTPNAKKLEDHERKKARRNEEREIKAKKERLRKAQEAREKAAKEAASGGTASGMPGGMPGAGGAGLPGGLGDLLNDPELMGALSDPEVAAAFQDIMSNPANIMKYQNNPRIMKLIEKMAKGMGGGIPGMGGMPGGMGGMPGGMGGMPGGMGGMPGGMGGMPGGMGGMPGGMGGMPGGMGGFGAGAPGTPPSSGGANTTPKPPSATDDLD